MLSSVRFWIGSSGHVIEIISVRIGGRSQYDSMGIKKKNKCNMYENGKK